MTLDVSAIHHFKLLRKASTAAGEVYACGEGPKCDSASTGSERQHQPSPRCTIRSPRFPHLQGHEVMNRRDTCWRTCGDPGHLDSCSRIDRYASSDTPFSGKSRSVCGENVTFPTQWKWQIFLHRPFVFASGDHC